MNAEEKGDMLKEEKRFALRSGRGQKVYLLLGSLILSVFLLDRMSKYLALAWLEVGQTWPVLPGFFHLTLVQNPGAAFGLLPYRTLFFIAATALAIILLVLAALYLSPRERALQIALALLAGGALGNFYDRLSVGYVVDFLDFRIWPVFNLADVAIVAGLVLFLINIKRFHGFKI